MQTMDIAARANPWRFPNDLAIQASLRYIRTYEMLTGESFAPGELPAGPRIVPRNLRSWAGSPMNRPGLFSRQQI